MATLAEETQTTETTKPSIEGVMGEFTCPHKVMQAAEKVRDAGYKNWDVHTPFPVHGLDKAMGIKPTILPLIIFAAGTTGVVTALALQFFTNAVDYKFSISGKPFFSLPASIPITFELMVLFSAFAAIGGMFALNKLPKHANALFSKKRFLRATSDRFFIVIESSDPAFSDTETVKLLEEVGATHIETIEPDTSSTKLPSILVNTLATLGILALFVPCLIVIKRYTTTEKTAFHIIPDMDYLPSYKAQNTSVIFADGRSMRPQVEGTVARGDLQEDDIYYKGIDPNGKPVALTQVSLQEKPAEGQAPKEEVDNTHWVTEIPIEITKENMLRGQARYKIYCSVCHGLSGEGDGLVTQRAQSKGFSTWVPPTQLSNPTVIQQPVGKLFNTITHGVRKMPGYESQIPVQDRWAIVLYVKALQKSRSATAEQVPADILPTLQPKEESAPEAKPEVTPTENKAAETGK